MRLLDLYCKAGGGAKGYADAGFEEIVGVDVEPQPHYPYDFVQHDALDLSLGWMREFDAIHASPPCQGYSTMTRLPWVRDKEYPALILPTMRLLEQVGRPYVLENVMGARRGSDVLERRELQAHGLEAGWLCGRMFGRPFYRHRLFAANWLWLAPPHPKHDLAKRTEEEIESKRHRKPVGTQWRRSHRSAEEMGIDWMNGEELSEAIPPVMTEHIGRQLLRLLEAAA